LFTRITDLTASKLRRTMATTFQTWANRRLSKVEEVTKTEPDSKTAKRSDPIRKMTSWGCL